MKEILKAALILVAGALLFWVGYELARPMAVAVPPTTRPGGFLFATMLFCGILIPLLVHELGHLLTGLWLGFKFQLFVVFLLGVKRTDSGIKVYLNTNLGYMGGVAASTPVVKDPHNKHKFATILLAGPIASLVLAILCLAFMLISGHMWRNLWLITGLTSLAIALATTLPKKSGMFFTDRARYQRLMSNGPAGAAEEALLNLMTQAMIDNAYTNISLADATLLQADNDRFVRFWGYYYAWQHSLAHQQTEAAAQLKKSLLAFQPAIPKALWKALQID